MVNYKLIQGDCIEQMGNLPDGSVDAIITDPPYLITDLPFDKQGFDLFKWIKEICRVIKKDGYLAVFAPIEMQAEISKVFKIRFSGSWVKHQGGMRSYTAKKPRNKCELYCVFAHPDYTISKLTWNKVFLSGVPYKRIQRNRGYQRGGKDQLDRVSTSSWTNDGYVIDNKGD